MKFDKMIIKILPTTINKVKDFLGFSQGINTR